MSADAKIKPAPAPMKVGGRARPFARAGVPSHLKVTADAIACTRCQVVVARPAGATLVVVEHLASCEIVKAAA